MARLSTALALLALAGAAAALPPVQIFPSAGGAGGAGGIGGPPWGADAMGSLTPFRTPEFWLPPIGGGAVSVAGSAAPLPGRFSSNNNSSSSSSSAIVVAPRRRRLISLTPLAAGASCKPGHFVIKIAFMGHTIRVCLDCPMGKFEQGHNCMNCRVGRYNINNKMTSCKSCVQGQYQDSTGRPTCKSPPPGHYQDQVGQIGYKACPAGKHSGHSMVHRYGMWGTPSCGACSWPWYQPHAKQHWCKRSWCNRYQYLKRPGDTICPNQGPALGDPAQCRRYTGTLNTQHPSCISCSHPNEQCHVLKGEHGWYRSGCWFWSKGSCLKCGSCPAGQIRVNCGYGVHPNWHGTCSGCPAGQFKASRGQWNTPCVRCPVGKYQSFPGRSSCNRCEVPRCPDRTYRLVCGHGAVRSAENDAKLPMTTPGLCMGCSICPIGKYNVGCATHNTRGVFAFAQEIYNAPGSCRVCGSHLPGGKCPKGQWLRGCGMFHEGTCVDYSYKMFVKQCYGDRANPATASCVEYECHPYLSLKFQENKPHDCLEDKFGNCVVDRFTSFELRRQTDAFRLYEVDPDYAVDVQGSTAHFAATQVGLTGANLQVLQPSTNIYGNGAVAVTRGDGGGMKISPKLDGPDGWKGMDFETGPVMSEVTLQATPAGLPAFKAQCTVPLRVVNRNEPPKWRAAGKAMALSLDEHAEAGDQAAYSGPQVGNNGGAVDAAPRVEVELNSEVYTEDDDAYSNNVMSIVDLAGRSYDCADGKVGGWQASELFEIDCAGVIRSKTAACMDYDESRFMKAGGVVAFAFVVRVSDPNPTLTYDAALLRDDLAVTLTLRKVDEPVAFVQTNFTLPYFLAAPDLLNVQYILEVPENAAPGTRLVLRAVGDGSADRVVSAQDPDGDAITFRLKTNPNGLFSVASELLPTSVPAGLQTGRRYGANIALRRPMDAERADGEGGADLCHRLAAPPLLSLEPRSLSRICFAKLVLEARSTTVRVDANVLVVVTNANDAPVIAPPAGGAVADGVFLRYTVITRFLPENAASGRKTSTDSAGGATGELSSLTSDQDATHQLAEAKYTYAIVGGADGAKFDINAADGTLSAKDGVVYDFENGAANEMEVTVTATDAGLTLDANPVESATFGAATSAPTTIRVVLTDVNEAPVIAAGNLQRALPENSPAGTRLAPLAATDVDVQRGHMAAGALTWRLLEQECAGCGAFEMDSATGELIIKAGSQPLNFEDFASGTRYLLY